MQVGFIAKRLLTENRTGTVLAVFDRSAYLELDNGIVCLATVGLPEGPLMVPCVRAGNLRIGECFAPQFDAATVWQSPVIQNWTVATLDRGLAAVGESPNVEDLFDILDDPVEEDLSGWLSKGLSNEPVAVPVTINRLVGLGPGLTPSGDDFLGGMMVALVALDRHDMASALFASLDLSRTNRISIAHLKAAREGAASVPLHLAQNGVLSGQTGSLPTLLAGLNLMGHRSGWDAFAGCCAVLRNFSAVENSAVRPFSRRRRRAM